MSLSVIGMECVNVDKQPTGIIIQVQAQVANHTQYSTQSCTIINLVEKF